MQRLLEFILRPCLTSESLDPLSMDVKFSEHAEYSDDGFVSNSSSDYLYMSGLGNNFSPQTEGQVRIRQQLLGDVPSDRRTPLRGAGDQYSFSKIAHCCLRKRRSARKRMESSGSARVAAPRRAPYSRSTPSTTTTKDS